MKYKYLISGLYGMNNGQTGFSENFVENNRKLNNMNEIDKVRNAILQKFDYKTFCILNIMRLKK